MPRANRTPNHRVRAGRHVIEEASIRGPEWMARRPVHDDPGGLWNQLASEGRDRHLRWLTGTRRIERDPASIRRHTWIPDGSLITDQNLPLIARVRVDHRDRVQAGEALDDQPPFVDPLPRPAAAVLSQRSRRAIAQAGQDDRPLSALASWQP